MTRFNEKIIVYYDRSSSSIGYAVRVKRDFNKNCVIIVEARIEDVESYELGVISNWTSSFSHECSFNSWQQFLNRRYNSERYVKDKEIYLY